MYSHDHEISPVNLSIKPIQLLIILVYSRTAKHVWNASVT